VCESIRHASGSLDGVEAVCDVASVPKNGGE